MLDLFLTEEHKKFRQEVQDLVESIPDQLTRDMDANRIMLNDTIPLHTSIRF